MYGSHHQTTTLRPPPKVARLNEERAPVESSVNPPSKRGRALFISIDRISLMLYRPMNSKWVCKKISLTTGWLRDSYWPTDHSLPELPIVYVSSSSCFRVSRKIFSHCDARLRVCWRLVVLPLFWAGHWHTSGEHCCFAPLYLDCSGPLRLRPGLEGGPIKR